MKNLDLDESLWAIKFNKCKPPIVNQQRVLYEFKCGLCNANYVGYTLRHLNERCEEHKLPSSSIYKHFKNEHGFMPKDITNNFLKILKKCTNKFDCLIFEMLFIRDKSPINVQSDSIKAKLFC